MSGQRDVHSLKTTVEVNVFERSIYWVQVPSSELNVDEPFSPPVEHHIKKKLGGGQDMKPSRDSLITSCHIPYHPSSLMIGKEHTQKTHTDGNEIESKCKY